MASNNNNDKCNL
jgi:hypothetical protein